MRIPIPLCLLFVLATPTLAPAASQDLSALAGDWLAEPVIHGVFGAFVLHLELADDGGIDAAFSLPPIGVVRSPAGRAVVTDGEVRVLGVGFDRTTDGRLAGTLPASLVPGHELAVSLERVPGGWQPSLAPGLAVRDRSPLWTVELATAVRAGVVVDGDRLLVAGEDGCLRSLAAADGALQWRACGNGAIRATPTIVDGDVVTHGDDGVVRRIGSSGEVRWAEGVAMKPRERDPAAYLHYGSAPVLDQGMLYFGTHEGHVFAMKADGGEMAWSVDVGGPVTASPAVGAGRIVVGTTAGEVLAIDRNGQLLWRFDAHGPVVSRPAIADGLAIVGSRSYELFALDLETGEPRWTFYLWYSWIESGAAVRDDTLYLGSSDAQVLSAIDVATGKLRWQYDTGGSAWAIPAVSERSVAVAAVGVADYLVAHAGSLTVLDRASGEPRWRFEVEPEGPRFGFVADPAIADGRVYAATLDGRVMAFEE